MLQQRYTFEQVRQWLVPRAQWRPFPPAADREAWQGLLGHELNRRRRDYVIGLAQGLLGQSWPALPATLYMDYGRTGTRAAYERPYFERRHRLGVLVLAECLQGRGQFVDEIIDGLWLITEEASWCIPAHTHPIQLGVPQDVLPRQDRPIVDLFASQTAMALAETHYLLAAELDAVTPAIRQRVRTETLARVVEPVMDKADFAWLKFIFNWNTWCSSNTLGAGLYLLDDPDRTAKLAWQLMGATDTFLAGQLPDGGCSEGPGYWGVAPGAMLILLELLHSRSGGRIDVYDEPLIAELGRYITRAHLTGPWFVTFADCPPRVGVRAAVTYQYGRRIGDRGMQELALLGQRGWDPAGAIDPPIQADRNGGSLTHMLRELFWVDPADEPGQATPQRDVWLADLQVMVARQSAADSGGLLLAAKAGHNGEHHNHNDVGQFILLLDGEPMVVDVGVETYTAKTFGPNRYDIWCIRGSAHNAPVVNGHEQAPGREHQARDVQHTADESAAELRMDLSGAYPQAAGIESLRRSIRLERGAQPAVVVRDEIALAQGPLSAELHLFTPGTVELAEGVVRLSHKGRTLVLRYDPATLSPAVRDWPCDDPRMQAAWNGQLTRITLSLRRDDGQADYELRFEP